MFERFTDRARKVMAIANQEAMRLQHQYIGTEHILLGLVTEGTGVGVNVLKNLNVDLRDVGRRIERFVKAGEDVVVIGKLPQTSRAKKVIEYAIEEARNFDHKHVGTEHLLLGLLREGDGIAAQVLGDLGVGLKIAREEIASILGSPIPFADSPLRISETRKATVKISEFEALDSHLAELTRMKDDYVSHADYESAARIRDEALIVDLIKANAMRKVIEARPRFRGDEKDDDKFKALVTAQIILDLFNSSPELSKRLPEIFEAVRKFLSSP